MFILFVLLSVSCVHIFSKIRTKSLFISLLISLIYVFTFQCKKTFDPFKNKKPILLIFSHCHHAFMKYDTLYEHNLVVCAYTLSYCAYFVSCSIISVSIIDSTDTKEIYFESAPSTSKSKHLNISEKSYIMSKYDFSFFLFLFIKPC